MRMYVRTGGLAVLVAAAIGLAACTGGTSGPRVASVENTSADPGGSPASGGAGGASSPAPGSAGNATRLVDEWAACMRGHGDPSQADPTIDTDGVIHITTPLSEPGTDSAEIGDEAHNSTGPCGSYLQAASKALLGGRPSPPPPSLAQQLKYAECMRAHGVPKFPDPNGSGDTDVRGLDPTGPVFLNADKVCSKETGEQSSSSPEPPGSIMVQSAGVNG